MTFKEKTCSKCKSTLPVSQFGARKDRKDGLRSHCKMCRSKEAKRYHEDNKDTRNEYTKKRYLILMNAPEKTISVKMKKCSACNKTKSSSEFGKKKTSSDGLRSLCKKCRSEKELIYRNKFPRKVAEIKRKSYQANKEKYKSYYAQYVRDNRADCNARTRKRQLSKLKRTPKWADMLKIKEVYRDCVEINLAALIAGCIEKFVVDHIIPLQGKHVSGLHVHNNLQIMTASDNAVKYNKFNLCEAP